jgi:hypothetical protein
MDRGWLSYGTSLPAKRIRPNPITWQQILEHNDEAIGAAKLSGRHNTRVIGRMRCSYSEDFIPLKTDLIAP